MHLSFASQLYTKTLQPKLLEASSSFYDEEGRRLTKEMSLVEYASHVERRLIEEDSRVDSFLVPSSRELLLDVVRKFLIEEHEGFLLDMATLKHLTKNRETLHLRRLYILFSQIDRLDLLKTRFLEAVKAMGLELLESLKRDSSSSASFFSSSSMLTGGGRRGQRGGGRSRRREGVEREQP